MRKVSIITAIVMALSVMTASVALAGPDGPTCFDVFGTGDDEIANHAQHVIGDYVTGVLHENQAWPPNGAVGGGDGAALPGGPGPGFHFPNSAPPGASFCTDSNSGVTYTNPAVNGRPQSP